MKAPLSLEGCQTLSIFLASVRVVCIWRCVWSIGGIILWGESRSNQRKNLSAATVHHKSLMDWPEIGPGCPRWGAGLKFLVHLNSNKHSVHKITRNTITLQNSFKVWPTRCNITQFFISVNCPTCFRWIPHPSSGAQHCIYSIWYLSNRYCYLPLSWLSWN